MYSLKLILLMITDIAKYIIFAQVILSWLVAFNILNLQQSFVRQVWQGLNQLTEPLYRRIRRFLPDMGGIDLSPMVVLVAILAFQIIIQNNL